jgi:hypothetical protein
MVKKTYFAQRYEDGRGMLKCTDFLSIQPETSKRRRETNRCRQDLDLVGVCRYAVPNQSLQSEDVSLMDSCAGEKRQRKRPKTTASPLGRQSRLAFAFEELYTTVARSLLYRCTASLHSASARRRPSTSYIPLHCQPPASHA